MKTDLHTTQWWLQCLLEVIVFLITTGTLILPKRVQSLKAPVSSLKSRAASLKRKQGKGESLIQSLSFHSRNTAKKCAANPSCCPNGPHYVVFLGNVPSQPGISTVALLRLGNPLYV